MRTRETRNCRRAQDCGKSEDSGNQTCVRSRRRAFSTALLLGICLVGPQFGGVPDQFLVVDAQDRGPVAYRADMLEDILRAIRDLLNPPDGEPNTPPVEPQDPPSPPPPGDDSQPW